MGGVVYLAWIVDCRRLDYWRIYGQQSETCECRYSPLVVSGETLRCSCAAGCNTSGDTNNFDVVLPDLWFGNRARCVSSSIIDISTSSRKSIFTIGYQRIIDIVLIMIR